MAARATNTIQDLMVKPPDNWQGLGSNHTSGRKNWSDWERIVRDEFALVDCEVDHVDDFNAAIATTRVGEIDVSIGSGAPHRILRIADHLSKPEDAVTLNLVVSGQSTIHQSGRKISLAKDEFFIVDLDQPYSLESEVPYQMVTYKIPKTHVREFMPYFGDFLWPSNPNVQALSRIASPMLVRLVETLGDPATRGLVEIGDILRVLKISCDLAFDNSWATKNKGTRGKAQIAALAKFVIEQNLGNADLNRNTVANHMRMSVRNLNLIFADEGLSLANYIRDRRISFACHLLTSPRYSHLSVTEVAYRCGLPHPAHFSRVFSNKLKMPPTEYRRRANVNPRAKALGAPSVHAFTGVA